MVMRPSCGKRPLSGVLAVIAVTLVLSSSHASWAQSTERVLVMTRPVRGGLVEALRIQLPVEVAVVIRDAPAGSSARARANAAVATLGLDPGPELALWLETAPDGTLVFFVADRSGVVARVQSARFSGERDSSIDRAVALKVREIIETRSPPPAVDHPAPADDDAEEVPTSLAGFAELGGFVATRSGDAGPQAAMAGALGLSLRGASWLFEAHAAARLPTAITRRDPFGRVTHREVVVGGGLRGGWVVKPFTVGAFTELGARLADAEGETPSGASGDFSHTIPYLVAGGETRAELVSWLQMRVALGVDIALLRRRLAVNDEVVLDLGRARAFAQLGVVATIPRW